MRVLVTGADGTIGARLVPALVADGLEVVGTTRRPAGAALPATDLADAAALARVCEAAAAVDHVVLLAAATSVAMCRRQPALTRAVNVDAQRAIAAAAGRAGRHVVLVSTSLVFDGATAHAAPDAPHRPRTEYGAQKSAAESAVRDAARDACVLRFSKVLTEDNARVRAWIADLRRGATVTALRDLAFSPIGADLAVAEIRAAIARRHVGVAQCSAPDEMTFLDLAIALASLMSVPHQRVVGEAAEAVGEAPVAHATLADARLSALRPEPSRDVARRVLAAALGGPA
ncbi:MAG: dTDP-4-dehydrorhamnose reductase [Actinomycetota bacterium]